MMTEQKLTLKPGKMNQGDMVANTKGLVLSVTQNGDLQPSGMVVGIDGTVALAIISMLSGMDIAGSFDAAQTKNKQTVISENI